VEKHRLLAMTDGVAAIIITIMVLELKVPHGADMHALAETWPIFLSYVLSFVYVAIYWNNHHHYFQLVKKVNGAVLWANFHLLFWLSLIPFTTAWMGEHEFAAIPTAVYGLSLLTPAIAWVLMQRAIYQAEGPDSALLAVVSNRDFKSTVSPLLYLAGIILSFLATWAALACYGIAALLWLMPDKRIERIVEQR
jgi:uncharacterized membrane protein